jgi:tRNA(adenine34) deaminase
MPRSTRRRHGEPFAPRSVYTFAHMGVKTSSETQSFLCREGTEGLGSTVLAHFFPRDEYFMRLALREAEQAIDHDDVPIGAVIVRESEVIGAGHNERELRGDPTAHAEVIALREAARALGSWRVLDAVMYVTLEPCAMCAGAIVLARMPRVIFGATDPKAGAAGSVLDVLGEPRLNHRPQVQGGLLALDSAGLLQSFFASRR